MVNATVTQELDVKVEMRSAMAQTHAKVAMFPDPEWDEADRIFFCELLAAFHRFFESRVLPPAS
jgi:hypothetical protein